MADWTAGSRLGALSASRYGSTPQRAQQGYAGPGHPSRAQAMPGGLAGAARPGAYPFGQAPGGQSPVDALAGFNRAQNGGLAKARLAVWLSGGLVSLALVAGIGVWGYRLVLRDVLGVPVVQADASAMRVAPDDPGGVVAADMGLSVNAVVGAGEAAAPSDILTLAPSTIGLAEEDMIIAQTSAEADEPMAVDAALEPSALEPAPLSVTSLDVVGVAQTAAPLTSTPPAATLAVADPARPMTAAEVQAFADAVAAGAAPLSDLAPLPGLAPVPAVVAAAAVTPAAVTPELIPASVPGVATALRPLGRPATAATLTASAPVEPVAAAVVPEAPEAIALTEAIAPGTNLVQLGAFDSAEIAASEWVRLSAEFADFMGGRERVIQEAESGGRTFFRLRATGFADLGDARRFCAALEAEDANCITVVVN